MPPGENSSDKPALPEKLSFEDLGLLDDPVLQGALSRVPDRLLAQAVRGAPYSLCHKIFTNISARRCETVHKEIENIGKLPEKTVETARKNMMKFVLNIRGAEETDSTEISSVVAAPAPNKSNGSDRSAARPPEKPASNPAKPAAAKPRRISQQEFVAFLNRLREQNPVLREIADKRRDALIKYWLDRTIRLPR